MVKVALAALLFLAGCQRSSESALRRRLASQISGTIQLPSGIVEVSSELHLAPGAHDLEIAGSGTTLKASDEFKGRAILVADGVRNLRLRDVSIDGNRIVFEKALEAAPPERPLREAYVNNGVLLDRVGGAEIANVTLANVANLAMVVSRSSKIRIHQLRVEDSGSLDAHGHSNATGGVAFEDGTSDFEVRSSIFRRIRGNALWTRPRVDNGVFAANRFDAIGRDAILIWNGSNMRVEDNTGARIGYPSEMVDALGQPAAIATLGDVDHSTYARNQFEDVNGKCLDLDGFHDGIVMRNQCVNRSPVAEYPFGHFGIVVNNTDPAMHPANIELTGNVIDGAKYGGLFLIGAGHRVIGNRFVHLNRIECDADKAGCNYVRDEPKMLESGIYLGRGGAHPAEARGNVIRDNVISGYRMKTRCIAAAPGVSLQANTLAANECSDEASPR